jgi:hypothetical protein
MVVLRAVIMKSPVFWDTTLCIPLKVNRCFSGVCRLYLQGQICAEEETTVKAGGKVAWLILRS